MSQYRPKRARGSRVKPRRMPPGARGATNSTPRGWLGIASAVGLAVGFGALVIWLNSDSHVPSPPNPSPAAGPSRQGAPEAEVAELVNRASQLIARQQIPEAVTLLSEALRLNPGDEDIHYNLGIAMALQGRLEESARHYAEALRLFPDYVEAHNNLGNLFMRLGQFERAVSHFRDAVRIMPDYAAGWNNLGNALQRTGQPKEAHNCYQRAVELKPDYIEAHFNLASSLIQQEQLAAARTALMTVLEIQPNFEPARTALATLDSKMTNPPAGSGLPP